MKYIIIVLILSIYAFSAKPSIQQKDFTRFYLKVYEADSLFEVKDYERSFLILDSLFQEEVPQCFAEVDAYLLYVEAGYLSKNSINNDLQTKILQGISQYGLNKEISKKDSLWQEMFAEANITDDEYELSQELYLSYLDLDLREDVYYHSQLDSYYHNNYAGADYEIKIKETDSINEVFLKQVFERGIYPNKRIIGNRFVDEHYGDILGILMNMNDSIRTHCFLPKLKQFLQEGKCSPRDYALVCDLNSSNRKEGGKYAVINFWRLKEKGYPQINQNRKKIGLPSVAYTKWKFLIKYTRFKKQLDKKEN